MNRLPPIPTPPSRRWREFRMRALPLITFVAGVGLAIWLWRESLAAPTLQGAIEAVRAEVVSPHAGTLVELKVARFQTVARGDEVAVIKLSDPRASLDLLRAEIDLLRARLEPRLSQQRNSTDFERLRLELLLQKAELAGDRVNLARSENELARNVQLFDQKLISAHEYDFSLKTTQQLRTQVDEKSKLIADLEQGLQRLAALGDPATLSPASETLVSTMPAHEEKLRQAQDRLQPITLVAPLDGTISEVYRQEGENVMDGEPILVIHSLKSSRIVGYLRQPFPIEPVVGMPVEVRARRPKAPVCFAEILHVGSQFEAITNALAMVRPGSIIDLGLPIEISLPPDLKARPGEVVDVIIRPQKFPSIR